MTTNDFANKLNMNLTGIEIKMRREGKINKLLIRRGQKKITIYIEPDKITMKNKQGKIEKLKYDFQEVLRTIKRELNINAL